MVVGEKPQFWQAKEQGGLVQNTHDDRFAMIGGDGGNAQVHLFVAHFELDAAVLRQAFFGDGHGAAHDLQAGNDGWQQFFRVVIDLDEFAIEAVADAH